MTFNENDGRIYLFGGYDLSKTYNDLWVYDYLSNTWNEIITSNNIDPRSSHGLIYDSYNNKLLFYSSSLRDLWAYDFKSKYWTFLSSTGPSGPYDNLNSWIMYGNSSLFMSSFDFHKLTLEMGSSLPATEIIVTHTETVTSVTTSTDLTTVTDQKTEINYEDVTRYQNITSLIEATIDETPFHTLGVFSVILVMLIRRKRLSMSITENVSMP